MLSTNLSRVGSIFTEGNVTYHIFRYRSIFVKTTRLSNLNFFRQILIPSSNNSAFNKVLIFRSFEQASSEFNIQG